MEPVLRETKEPVLRETKESSGGLNGALVNYGFWPACANCTHVEECKVKPRHEAFPHNWHWAREFREWGENALIIKSWVGSSTFGAEHTGCYEYLVDPSKLLPLDYEQKAYLELSAKIKEWEARCEAAEHIGRYPQEGYDRLDQLYKQREALIPKRGAR